MKLSKILKVLETTKDNLDKFISESDEEKSGLEDQLQVVKEEGYKAKTVRRNLGNLLGES